jgi:hypothetical protein
MAFPVANAGPPRRASGTKDVAPTFNGKPARLSSLGGRTSFVFRLQPRVIAVSKVRALDMRHKTAPALDTPTDLSEEAVRELSTKLNAILADSFALYLKTKNFHWHVSGPHFRDYHLLLDEQGEQIFASTDDIAERVRKIGGTTLRSISQIGELQNIKDNNARLRARA